MLVHDMIDSQQDPGSTCGAELGEGKRDNNCFLAEAVEMRDHLNDGPDIRRSAMRQANHESGQVCARPTPRGHDLTVPPDMGLWHRYRPSLPAAG